MSEDITLSFFNRQFERLFTVNGGGFSKLTAARTVNRVGTAVLEIPVKLLPYDFSVLSQEDLMMIIEIHRRGQTVTPEFETVWLLRKFAESNNNKEELFRLTFRDALDILKRRIIPYKSDNPEGTEIRTRLSGPGNLEMNRVVNDNYGITTEPDRRIPELTTRPITQPSVLIEKEIAFKNLLSILQQISRTSKEKGERLFYDMVALPVNNGINFQFRTYLGQRGIDKSGQEHITTDHPLVKLTNFIIDYDFPSVAYVAGQGRGADRQVVSAVTQRASSSPLGRIEVFKSEQSTDINVLQDEANELVSETGIYRLEAQLLGEMGNRYNFGDRLQIAHRDVIIDSEISSIRLDVENQVIEKRIVVKSID